MQHITVHGWVGKWDREKKYMFSPINITVSPKDIVLFDNPRGSELYKTAATYDPDSCKFIKNNNGIELRTRPINQNGPRYGAVILGTRYELDLEGKEFKRLKKYLKSA